MVLGACDGEDGGDAGVDVLCAFEFADFPAAFAFVGCGRLDMGGEDRVAVVGESSLVGGLVEALVRVRHRRRGLLELDHGQPVAFEDSG